VNALDAPNKPMSDAEAKDWIAKHYGNATEWRKTPEQRVNETEAYLVEREIAFELKKRGTDDPTELFRERPDLYRRSRATAVKVGSRILD
jgi:hypothetical protein